ncbi:MAG: hypothetical protein RUMPE_01119 [Eubacteriales bacterium SKADARSKE-1]|nr:hypothetical protein [Eubacteriales bacterium SKADARSKE-1]
MKDIEKLKKKLELDEGFKNLFLNVKDLEEAVDLARQYGFDVDESQVSADDNLTDDMLEAVAGGKKQKEDITNTHNYYVE